MAKKQLSDKVPENSLECCVQGLYDICDEEFKSGEPWNKHCNIDWFFDAISDCIGDQHMSANLGTGVFPIELPLAKATGSKLKSSIRKKVVMLINCMTPVEGVNFPE